MTYNNAVNNLFFTQKVTTVSIDYTVLPDDVIICVSDTSAQRQITLPAPSLENQGKCFVIKDSSGGAGTYPITVKSAAGSIDGTPMKTIASSYGSLKVYSDGRQYFSYITRSTAFAKGGWVKFAKTSFPLNNTQIAQSFTSWNQPMPATAQVDFSELKSLAKPENLIQAGGKITFTQPGLYQVACQMIVDGTGNPVLQLVRNATTLLSYFVGQVNRNYRVIMILHTQRFAANDFMDFRIGIAWGPGSYSFYNIACFVRQLPMS